MLRRHDGQGARLHLDARDRQRQRLFLAAALPHRAAGAIDAAAIATDAIDADALKADAITEIQAGLATSAAVAAVAGYVDTEIGTLITNVGTVITNLATVAGYVDTEIGTLITNVGTVLTNLAAVQADTDDIQARLPATLDSGLMRSTLAATTAGAIDVISFSSDALAALFGLIYQGRLTAFTSSTATLNGLSAADHALRGCLLHVYSGDGVGTTWVIADNTGDVLQLVGSGWPLDPELSYGEEDNTTLVAVVRFGESFGTLFDEGGASVTNGRQIQRAIAGVLLGAGVNVGQVDEGSPAEFKTEDASSVLEYTIVDGVRTPTWTKGAP